MARTSTKKNAAALSAEWGTWNERIAKQMRVYSDFCKTGHDIVERYRLERRRATNATNQGNMFWRDKYNILYSSTETMRPALYAKTPKPQVDPRQRDTTSQTAIMASMILESSLNYAIEEVNFDNPIKNAISDYLLPGLGMVWVRYDPEIMEGEGSEYVNSEGLALDYVHYKDILTSEGRVWEDLWWIAKRVYFFKEQAKKRFGEQIANKLNYTHQKMDKSNNASEKGSTPQGAQQAVIWEIWCKRTREVLWFSEDCPELLDKKVDPLKLKDFYPCPEPLRAVTVTETFTPTSFYSQYRQQAETLDTITSKIRILSKALRLVGVYDQSQEALSRLLTGDDNKMVGVENWAQFAGQGGMNGNVQFLPIQEVATVLSELYKQREIAKNEIYEITGFSDIVRGVSKASETLGAQEIKNQWAGGRLQMLQKEVQRFCRDILRIMAEIMAEQFSDESLALYSGFELPEITPEEQQAIQQSAAAALQGQPTQPPPPTQRQMAIEKFKEVVTFIRNEKLRCSRIDVETDSTLMPDEMAERKDRMDFLGAMGAFLQQAGPMAMQFPDMRGLLGALMMFTARTFNASRPIEKEFEQFQKALQAAPAVDPNKKEGGDDGQTKLAAEQMKQQTSIQIEQAKGQASQAETEAKNNAELQRVQMELQAKERLEKYKIDTEARFKDRELALREREVAIKEAELGIKRDDMEHKHEMEEENASREDERLENERVSMDRDAENAARDAESDDDA